MVEVRLRDVVLAAESPQGHERGRVEEREGEPLGMLLVVDLED